MLADWRRKTHSVHYTAVFTATSLCLYFEYAESYFRRYNNGFSCGSALTVLFSGLALMDIMLAAICKNFNSGECALIDDIVVVYTTLNMTLW